MHARAGTALPSKGTPVVILVHGLAVSSTYMTPTAVRLAPFCRVYAVDLPGFGRSYTPPCALSLSALADALALWMDALNIPKAHLAGNSFGCQVLAEFAVRHPDHVDRLVLQGPTVDPGARTFHQQIFRLLLDSQNEPLPLIRIALKDYWGVGLKRAVETLKIALEDRIEEKLPHIAMPTLVVQGGKDPLVPQRWAEEVTRLLPRGEIKVIPGVGHAVNYAAPVEFVRAMRSFLLF